MTEPLFDASVRREMQALSEASLPSRATLFILDRQTFDGGRVVETWVPALTDVPCRLSPGSPPSSREAVAGQLQAETAWTIVFPLDTPIVEGCKVIITGTDLYDVPWAKTLYVVDAHGPFSYEVLRKVAATDAPPRSAP